MLFRETATVNCKYYTIIQYRPRYTVWAQCVVLYVETESMCSYCWALNESRASEILGN